MRARCQTGISLARPVPILVVYPHNLYSQPRPNLIRVHPCQNPSVTQGVLYFYLDTVRIKWLTMTWPFRVQTGGRFLVGSLCNLMVVAHLILEDAVKVRLRYLF